MIPLQFSIAWHSQKNRISITQRNMSPCTRPLYMFTGSHFASWSAVWSPNIDWSFSRSNWWRQCTTPLASFRRLVYLFVCRIFFNQILRFLTKLCLNQNILINEKLNTRKLSAKSCTSYLSLFGMKSSLCYTFHWSETTKSSVPIFD